ncbi:MAG: outer membrane protein [Yoonia sp.]|uniref:outer membrane protein n=1 Tax=Yoonia sp. TaxID=2212373 RepID=UPI003EF47071
MKHARFAPAFAAAALLATPALAETELSFYLGGQSSPHSVVTGTDPGNAVDETPDFTAKWEGRSFEAPIYYGLRATRWQSDTFGWGAEFTHAKVYSDQETRDEGGFSHFEMTDGINILTANAYRRWPNALGAVTPYVSGGVGLSIPHVEVISDGGRTWGYQVTGPATRLTAGARYAITEDWGVFGEYQNTVSFNDMELDNGGALESRIITNALNVGVSFNF